MPVKRETVSGRQGGLRRSRIGRQLSLYFAIILLLFVVTGFVYFLADRDVESARSSAQHTSDVLTHLSQLSLALRSQESGLRGYLIAGQEELLGSYEAGKTSYERGFRQLRFLMQESRMQAHRLDRLSDLRQRWEDEVANPVLVAGTAGDLEQARLPVTSGKGPRLLAAMHVLVDEMAAHERQLLTARQNAAALSRWRARAVIFGMAIFGLMIVLGALLRVRQGIVRPLNRVTEAVREVAEGDLGYDIPHQHSRGEIGDTARALEHFRKTAQREEANRWVREQLGQLTYLIVEAGSLSRLGNHLLSELAPLVGAESAAFYALDEEDGRYHLAGAYGLSADAALPGFGPGDGVAGEAARKGEFRQLSELPEGYLKIQSGLGEKTPDTLLIAPGGYEHLTRAVIELARFGDFRKRDVSLLEALMPVVAIAVASLDQRDKTAELLRSTREQAEQLRASDREIRDSNEELRRRGKELAEQSQALQASEEELRVQAEELQATNEELRQNGDELEAQQRELLVAHDELERKANQLEQVSRYKSEFLANMSHELRTPLNSLLILSRSLSENRQGNLDDDQREAADTIHQSGKNLLTLINDILDLSKVEAGKLRVHASAVSLQTVVSNLERNFQPLAEEKALSFAIEVAEHAPAELFTDAGRLEQVLRNLLSNAFKFTEEGGVRLTVQPPESRLSLRRAGLESGAIAFVVEDDGIGIPAEKLERIFQAFEQVDASTSRVYGGTGLGLSISRHLASLLGGEIHVTSRQGKGSRFTLVVPARMQEAPGAPAPETRVTPSLPSEPALRSGPADILIIEDDSTFAGILEQEARQRGCLTRVAPDGETGLAMAAERVPTGILLDIGLPGMDGWAVLEALKQRPDTADVPVHIISAGDDDGRAAGMGAAGYLPKPVDSDALASLLATVGGDSPGKRLLMVDDDPAARQAIRELLAPQPVDLVFAETGAAALKLIEGGRFDCILMDLNLPDMSGFELLEREPLKSGGLPVIVFSARDLTDEETGRLREHTDSIVIKGGRSADRLLDEVNLFLHRLDGQPRAATAMPQIKEADLAGKTALVVDDDMRNTFALSRILRDRGMQVLMAQDGRKALAQLEQNEQVDIVLMDIMMPVMDGYETMQEIRKRPEHAKLPMIALTAKAMAGDRQKCLDAGANEYLPKPIDVDKLLSLMRAWIQS